MLLRYIFIFKFLSLAVIASANEPVAIGQWRVHLPYANVKAICETPEKIYCASENGLFSFSKFEGSTERLSPVNGFSGYQVDAMTYDWVSGTLICAYADCRIYLISNNKIERNDDIFRKTIIGEKTIHHMQVTNGIVYIGTSFGLLELNIAKNEIRNSYLNIGPSGTVIDVFSSTIAYDSVFISTKSGIYRGSANSNVNLADYTNWYLSKSASIASNRINAFNNDLYAEIDSQIYKYSNKSWKVFEPGAKRIITNIDVNHNKLIIGAYGDSIITVDASNNTSYYKINILTQCLIDDRGLYWYSSPANGLVLKQDQINEVNYYPNGPRAVDAYCFTNAYGNLWAMAGGFRSTTDAPTFNGNKYYYFDNFEWTSSPENPFTYPLSDYVVSSFQKSNGRLYIGCFGKGLLQLNNGIPTTIYDETNSPLEKRAGLYTIVRGLASDSRNNLWVSNFGVDSCLLQLSASGKWTSYKLPIAQGNTGKIVIDSKNRKWILTPKESCGFLVFDDKGTAKLDDDVSVMIGTGKGNGNLPSTAVNDIAFTKSGELLIGTDQGFVRMRNPGNALTGGDFDAQYIIVSVEANSNLGGKLLENEVINCIVIDGGDRRWFGTNKGAWLYDSDGETLLHHFTTENSPLMSDNVLNIGIMESTGEVFFGTDKGIASFRSDALPDAKNMSDITIFPNPVRPEFEGNIAITGLTDNALVKITDINGALVYQTYANGGMATWNGNTFDGTKVATGVYLVFCINTEGTETRAGKILFVN